MDAYAFVLEGLRDDGFRRLGHFDADGRSTFRTWLVVVARRLCHDFHRARYGQSREKERSDGLRLRARLADLAGVDVDLHTIPYDEDGPEAQLRRRQLRQALDESLQALSPEDRLLLTWRFEDEVPVREIRELTEAPSVFHVYRRLRSVLATVRAELARRGVEGPRP